MTRFASALPALALLLGAATSADPAQGAQTGQRQAGVVDAFALPADPVAPRPDYAALTPFQALDLIAGVNGGTINTNVIHSFTDLPAGIVGGTLELRVRGGDPGGTGGVETDGVWLAFADETTPTLGDAVVFSRTFGPNPAGGIFDADPGLVQGSPWSTGDDAVIVFDLSALPLAAGGTHDIVPELAQRRYLDVGAGDESGADYFRLTLQYVPVPALPAWGRVTAAALLALAARRRVAERHARGP